MAYLKRGNSIVKGALDYEQGIYVPTHATDGGSTTRTQNTLGYTKNGGVVHVYGSIVYSASSMSGTWTISLPFTAHTDSANASDIWAGAIGSYAAPFNSRTMLIWRINGGGTTMAVYGSGDNQAYTAALPDADSEYFFQVTYMTDA